MDRRSRQNHRRCQKRAPSVRFDPLVGWGYVLAAYGVAKDYITKAEFIPSVMILASSTAMMFASGKSEKGTVHFKFGEREARWKGALVLSVLLSGVLLLALIEWKKT